MKKRSAHAPRLWRRIISTRNPWMRCIGWCIGVWFGLVIVYRFIAPPITPLMVIRSIQGWDASTETSKRWKWVPLSDVPRSAQQVIVAAEDARFMEHWGVDPSAIADALRGSSRRSRPRGASTITMQTVKNLFLWPGRSYVRKGIEAVMAPLAGLVWGKRRTLELYLNIVEWGDGIYGIEAASQAYFHRPSSELTVAQAAALASILPNPRRFSPHALSASSRRRVDRILREWHTVQVPISRTQPKGPRKS